MKPLPFLPKRPFRFIPPLLLSLGILLLAVPEDASKNLPAGELSLLGTTLAAQIAGTGETEAREVIRRLRREWPRDYRPVLVPGNLPQADGEIIMPNLPRGTLTQSRAERLIRTQNQAQGQIFFPQDPSEPLIWGLFLPDPEGYLLILRMPPLEEPGARGVLSGSLIRRGLTLLALGGVWFFLMKRPSSPAGKKTTAPEPGRRQEGQIIALEENLDMAQTWLSEFGNLGAKRSLPDPWGVEAQVLAERLERLRDSLHAEVHESFLIHQCVQNTLLFLSPKAEGKQVTIHARYDGPEKSIVFPEPFFRTALIMLLLTLVETVPSKGLVTVIVSTGQKSEIRLSGAASIVPGAAVEKAHRLLEAHGGGVTRNTSPGGLVSFNIHLPL